MSAFRDAADNIRHVIVAMWVGMTPEGRALAAGLAVGLLAGGVMGLALMAAILG